MNRRGMSRTVMFGVILGGLVTLSIVAGLGTMWARAQSAGGVIYACIQKSDGTFQVARRNQCGAGETLVSWNVQGPQGTTGLTGPQGSQGPTGASGPMGASGQNGPTGGGGPSGAAGVAGPTGASGPAGLNGPSGASGPTGPSGPVGATGANGLQGLTGPTGFTGPSGSAGPTGSSGPSGPSGAPGATGLTGGAGGVGATGPTGLSGPSGPRGDTGPSGVPGASGASGPAGAVGASGARGSTGPAGADGRVTGYEQNSSEVEITGSTDPDCLFGRVCVFSASCSTNKAPLSGGVYFQGSSDYLTYVGSVPTSAGWMTFLWHEHAIPSTMTLPVTAYVVCANVSWE